MGREHREFIMHAINTLPAEADQVVINPVIREKPIIRGIDVLIIELLWLDLLHFPIWGSRCSTVGESVSFNGVL